MDSKRFSAYEENFDLLGDYMPGGFIVYYADGDEEIIYANRYIVELFECDTVEEFLELTQGSFHTFVYGEDIDTATDSIWGQVKKENNLDHIYYRIKTKSGRLLSVDDYGRLVERSGERPIFYVFITELVTLSSIDWLTGLPGMSRFHELAGMGADAIRQRGERPVAISLDLVGMKAFNTQYGREAGDHLLCVFGDVLRKHFGNEACSRFSEDHFYAFASEVGINERMEALFEDFKVANGGKTLPVRAGAYTCDSDEDIVGIGFDWARIACDSDKKTWNSHLLWFSDEMRGEALLRIHILESVERAIEEGWIQPYYQSIMRASTSYICGEEALARWIDPQYGLLSPALFIPILEEAGLLQKLDIHMVDCVLADLKRKMDAGLSPVPVSVNISLRDLTVLDVAGEICRRLDAAGIPHNLLRIEFTESAASEDPEFFREQVDALRSEGFEVWLDDFGSGYSSLNTLQIFDFDLIKLDMNFIRDLDNVQAQSIVSGVVQTAKKMGVNTLSEGVETEEQALFMESIGCDMLQGYFYSQPQSLDSILADIASGNAMFPENLDEKAYWNTIGLFDVANPTANVEELAADGSKLSEFPAGVMERRGDTWRLLRANTACRKFLDRGGAIPLDESNLQPILFENGVDEEYSDAAFRSLDTGLWERIAGRMEYGTGLQFYTKPLAFTSEGEAYSLVSVPTMLGTALGTYGDVPVAYAVLRAIVDQASGRVVDAEYVYANLMYCQLAGYEQANIPGSSFDNLSKDNATQWYPYFYTAAVLGQNANGTIFDDEVGHWLSFNVSPSPVNNCFVFAYTVVDDEHREQEEIRIERDTSDLIIDIANVFNIEKSYEAAMNGMLETISRVIHPEYLYLFECFGNSARCLFKWQAEDAKSAPSTYMSMDAHALRTWKRLLSNGDSMLVVPDIAKLEGVDKFMYDTLRERGVTHLLAVPLNQGAKLVGFLVADNYELEEGLKTNRLLETTASFVSSRIVNQRLLDELELAGTHDALTGLRNRRGIDLETKARLSHDPGQNYVLALVDIDDFKTLNDTHGHDVGDEALRVIAREIGGIFSDDAILGRNGGDEFLVMLFGEEAQRADELFERLSNVNLEYTWNGKQYHTSLSIGFAEYPQQVSDLKNAYASADNALYAVKLVGKSGWKRYTSDVESRYRTLLGFSSRDLAEYIPGGIMVHKATGSGEILFANDELISMLECENLSDFMEFTGGVSEGTVFSDDRPRVRAELERQVREGTKEKAFTNYRFITKSGRVRNAAANSRFVELQDIGPVFYVIIVDRDERVGNAL